MRSNDQAGAFAGKKFLYRFDLLWSSFLLRHHMIQTEHQQRVGVIKNSLVERQPLPCLVYPLIIDRGMPCSLAHQILESHYRQVEEFQRASDALKKHLFGEV